MGEGGGFFEELALNLDANSSNFKEPAIGISDLRLKIRPSPWAHTEYDQDQ